ncbi:MAG: zinc-dependent alcohol dehydrogenase [Marvinbryantia sp.]|uniref:zinc-dependent alcohol dehydrogenase n=1 Tax=Marvinbryantia sp. TaxID=2496532 RepID=UPI0025E50D98|nr:zinc-binding alcohol dehydrogenase [uncultured Marvinbryantia sp.]
MILNKKIVAEEPGRVEVVEDTLDESALQDNEILVKKKYSLVSAGTESACITGKELWFSLPGTLGYSAVGEITAAGDRAKKYQVGDIVYFQGKHSAYEIIDEKDVLLKVSDIEHLEYIPFLRMAAISSSAVRASEIEFGDFVLVVGQGLIGLMAMQLARLQGARVLVSDTSAKRLALAKELGADYTLNPAADDMGAAISEITKGTKVDTLIDATGSSKVICDNLQHVKIGGEAILLGSPRAPYEANVTQIFQYIHQFRYRIDVKGAHESRYPKYHTPYVKHSTQRTLEILLDFLRTGRFQVAPMLTQLLPPQKAPEVYRHLAKGDEDYLGIVYDWTKD